MNYLSKIFSTSGLYDFYFQVQWDIQERSNSNGTQIFPQKRKAHSLSYEANISMKSKCDKVNARKENHKPKLFVQIAEKILSKIVASQF